MSKGSSDRNLLFAVLALQADVISSPQFIEACTLWANQKEVELANLLVNKGWITAEDKNDVERLVERKLKKHGGDVHASLGAAMGEKARQSLAGVEAPAVRASLAELASAPGHVKLSTIGWTPEARDRYTRNRLHSKGGIGLVWLARDTDLEREVALKELRPEGADHPIIRARFFKEAKITGQLEHPGIVPIYELGQRSDNQQPFYTMRFVRGRTLTEAIRAYHQKREKGQAGPLDLRTLLTAFVSVCNAVAYAHSRGVIHRDLKGSNVVLGDFGEVIVLDWGLAKLVDQPEGTDDSAPVAVATEPNDGATVQGQVLGTPAYMAPEQAEGRLDWIDLRTDVYGLGAILYEILTDRPPFTGRETHEVLKQVLHNEPRRPREVVAGTSAALEAVCLKALAKKPVERYESARALAQEVEHWLADEPVSAYREPLPARVARWGRRHRALVTGAGALLLTVVVALAVGVVLIDRERADKSRAYELAEAQRRKTEVVFRQARLAVDTYFTQVSEEQLLHEPGMQPLREKLLKSALAYYQDFQKQHADDPSLHKDLAYAYYRLGSITGEVGSRDDAKAALQKAVQSFETLHARDPENLDVRRGLAQTYVTLAFHQVFSGQVAQAEDSAKAAIVLLEKLIVEQPKVSDHPRLLGRSHDIIGISRVFRGQHAEAEPYFERAIGILERAAKDFPEDTEARRLWALAHNNHGTLHDFTGNLVKREKALRQAIAIYQDLAEGQRSQRIEKDLARSQANLGNMLDAAGRPTAALESCRQAYDLLDRLVKENPRVLPYQELLGDTAWHLGKAHLALGQTTAADKLLRQAKETRTKLQALNPKDMDGLDSLAQLVYAQSVLQASTGDAALALDSCSKAVTMEEEVLKVANPKDSHFKGFLLLFQEHLIFLEGEAGKINAAKQISRQLDLLKEREALAREHPKNVKRQFDEATACARLVEYHLKAGSARAAPPLLHQASLAMERIPAIQRDHFRYEIFRSRLMALQARVEDAQGRSAEALESAQRAIAATEKLAGVEKAYLVDLACHHGLRHALLSAKKNATDEEKKQVQGHADAALEALAQALRQGYEVGHRLKNDSQLASLRDREEMRKMIQILELKK